MSNIQISLGGVDKVLASFDAKESATKEILNNELNKFGLLTTNQAKRLAPVDEGNLRNKIIFEKSDLKVAVIVAADYAAYIEFGTRKFAAGYVASLPSDWQTFALQFKGPGGGTFAEFLNRIVEWVHRKGLGSGKVGSIGIAGTYSVKTGKRTGGKATQESEDKSAAYRIALSIIRNGIRPQPFLFPSVRDNTQILIENLKKQI